MYFTSSLFGSHGSPKLSWMTWHLHTHFARHSPSCNLNQLHVSLCKLIITQKRKRFTKTFFCNDCSCNPNFSHCQFLILIRQDSFQFSSIAHRENLVQNFPSFLFNFLWAVSIHYFPFSSSCVCLCEESHILKHLIVTSVGDEENSGLVFSCFFWNSELTGVVVHSRNLGWQAIKVTL